MRQHTADYLDIHTHVLPWTDDGAVDIAMTRDMMRAARKAGIGRIVATPHLWPTTDIWACHAHFEEAQEAAAAAGIRLYRGAEVRFDALRAYLDNPMPLCVQGTRHLLTEFFSARIPADAIRVLGDLCDRRFSPIIVHPERYLFIQTDLGMARDLIGMGCVLQVDAGALLLGKNDPEGSCARTLLENGMAAYVASDAHRPRHYQSYERARAKFAHCWPASGPLESLLP